MKIPAHFPRNNWKKVLDFSRDKQTPFVVLDLEIIKKRFMDIKKAFPYAKIYYAIKANPAKEIIELLRDLDSCFDIASIYELDHVLSLGVKPERVSYGNTIKKGRDIAYFYQKGVRLFASDSEEDLQAIAENAPGCDVFIRILTEGSHTAEWPLSRKFGCHADMAVELLMQAKKLGLRPRGISFHVGSQQKDISAWDSAIGKVRFIADRLKEQGDIDINLINMGGGLPAHYFTKIHEIPKYGKAIQHYLEEDFGSGDELPEIIIEPGRALVGDAGVLVSEVVLVSRKSRDALNRWVYLDIGKFGGLIETLDESIRYPIYLETDAGEAEEVVLAGPTCDSMDILYEDYKYALPMDLKPGDRIYWFSTGAYTTTYSSIEFNGFPPLKSYCIK
ncbi:MAG: type III PLP-dependent enzyme [Gammaproteobacteria bacterium]|nr:MAG: type III PLP-dependent enzyme [Gammaproteobacteria bacterium]